ncbi:hypothetical protein DES32_0667 [Methylovirgula ligni]|uniref:Uncharacterized protein n=1 Tax=Methylovirgula ligni TaxID=569860 RepID=A0A3D9ZDB7_9HYPH|nr:hypothetical protein [Methylovirgula ligni]REF89446.1 hypothetical protein DES32_0667 [Methylovirgula ligni]
MPTHTKGCATLTRLERARAETARHLNIIEHQIAARAERMVITFRTKARQFGRGKSTWTPPDEHLYRENLAILRFERRAEIDALARKLARQSAAMEAFRLRPHPDPGAMSQGNATFPVDRGIRWRENLAVQSQASPTRRKAVGGSKGGGL